MGPGPRRRRKWVMKKPGIGLWTAILWVVAGILIMIFPDVLNWLLGVALISLGILSYFRK